MRISRVTVTLGLLSISVALLSPTSPTSADPGQPTPRTTPVPTAASGLPVNFATDAATRLDSYGRQRFPDVFGGVLLTEKGTNLKVFLTSLDSTVMSSFRTEALSLLNTSATARSVTPSLISDRSVSFTQSSTTQGAQEAVHDAVSKSLQSIRDRGINLVWAKQDFTDRREHLGVVGLTPDQRSYLVATYGPSVDVEDIPESEAPILLDRHDDSPPWNGGDFITSNAAGSEECSTGIPTHTPDGGQYMLTASHCYPLGATVLNGAYMCPSSGPCTSYGTLNEMGFVAQRDGAVGGLDAELIFTPTSALLWTGYTFNAIRTGIAGTYGSPGGMQMCADGAWEGQASCSFTVDAQGCVLSYCNQLHASGSDVQAVGEGDSGGPALTYLSDGRAYVIGIISSGDGALAQCNNWNPQQVPRRCRSNVWYTDWAAMANKWGLIANIY